MGIVNPPVILTREDRGMDLAIQDTNRATDRILILTTARTTGITIIDIQGKKKATFICPGSTESGQIFLLLVRILNSDYDLDDNKMQDYESFRLRLDHFCRTDP